MQQNQAEEEGVDKDLVLFCEIVAMTKLICMQEYDSIRAFRRKNSCNNKKEEVTVMK